LVRNWSRWCAVVEQKVLNAPVRVREWKTTSTMVKVNHAVVEPQSALLFVRLKMIVVESKVETVKTLSVEWSKDGLKINAWWGLFCELRLQLIYRVGTKHIKIHLYRQ
jgi:hypothetical protein